MSFSKTATFKKKNLKGLFAFNVRSMVSMSIVPEAVDQLGGGPCSTTNLCSDIL